VLIDDALTVKSRTVQSEQQSFCRIWGKVEKVGNGAHI
jgi:hypothetical protein